MTFLTVLLIRLSLFSLPFATIFAGPVDRINHERTARHDEKILAKLLTRAAGDTASDPIDLDFDITGWPNIAEEDCYTMLCLLDGNRVYQKVPTANMPRSNYVDSGASLKPFRADQLATRHTAQINADTINAEEFPWESMQEGGSGAYVYPTTMAEQSSQAVSISQDIKSVPYGKFFRVTFQPASSFGTYCTALFSNSPDDSVCQNSNLKQTLFGVADVVLADFAYKVVKDGQPFSFVHGAGSQKGAKRSEDV